MIKATLRGKEGPIYLLGLSDMNIDKLREKKPLTIDLRELGGTGEVVICWGHTEGDIACDLMELIGPDTKIVGTPPATPQ